jgi:hypothetical protein
LAPWDRSFVTIIKLSSVVVGKEKTKCSGNSLYGNSLVKIDGYGNISAVTVKGSSLKYNMYSALRKLATDRSHTCGKGYYYISPKLLYTKSTGKIYIHVFYLYV